MSFIFAFIGGILVSFTPCVYPLIPVTIGYIGASSNSRLRGFLLSLFYVLGIAITYSLLGITAALSGKIFGSFTVNALTYLIVGNIFLILALSMLGVFEIPLFKLSPNLGVTVTKKKNLLQALVVGFISGLVVGPCTAPALGAILTYVASRQNVFLGAGLLFCFAYGMGTLLIVIGTFSGLLVFMPKSGMWMVRIKKICGLILLLATEYFLIIAGRFFI